MRSDLMLHPGDRWPGFLGKTEECTSDLRIVQASRSGSNDLESFFERLRAAIGTVGSDRVEGIRHREDPGANGNLFCLQAAQITAAIVTFMMRPDQLCGFREKRDLLDQVEASLHVLLHEHALLRGEGTRFEEYAVGESELPNVMQVCAHGNRFVMRFGKAHGFGDFQRKAADATGMAFGCGVAKVNCGAEGFESVFKAAFHQLKS